MNIDVYNTHIEVYPYKKDDIPMIEDMYTATDKFTNQDYACGYMIDDERLYLPRGTSISKLENLTGAKARYIEEDDEVDVMNRNHSALYDPRNKIQEESIKFLKGPEKQLALNLKTGVGKMEPVSRKIPCPDTESGYKLMGDIKAGDRVFGSDGKIINVLQVFPQGVQDIYQITFSDGRIAECGLDHLWNVFHPWSPNKVMTLRLRDFINDYKVYRSSMLKTSTNREPYEYRYNIQLISNPLQYPHRDVPVDPYTLGALIGNGCLTENPLAISSGDSFVPEKIADKYGFDIIYPSSNFTYRFRIPDGNPDNRDRVQLNQLLKDLPELIGKKSHEKFIPSIYMYNDLETRMELLRGLMDTDGYIANKDGNRFNITYSSCSRKLLEQIQELIRGLGFIANISSPDKRVDKYINGYYASVSIRVPQWFKKELFTHPRKLSRALEAEEKGNTIKQKFKYLKIKDIKFVRREEAQCIMVDSPDNLYLTEDFIVTHNTYCVAFASTELNEKTIIITPNESLKQQWIKTYHTMFEYRTNQLMNIAGSNIMEGIMDESIPIDNLDVFFVNHQTLRSYLTQKNGYELHNFFKKIRVGIKVYDESHMEFGNILLIDFFSNTKRTWYLTATFDRSDKTESACFKRAFQSVIGYGEVESSEVNRKHVIYHTVNINSMISTSNRAKVNSYPGFNSGKYGQYGIFDDPNDTLYKTILEILDKTKDVEGKTLIFLPLIDCVDEVVKRLKKDCDKSVAAYHSKISKDEKEDAEKKDIIVSTIKSCGTGRDIKGLRILICAEPVVSKVVTEQMIGRLRPYAPDKDTYFFDIVDRSITQMSWWHRARFRKIESLVKEVININM